MKKNGTQKMNMILIMKIMKILIQRLKMKMKTYQQTNHQMMKKMKKTRIKFPFFILRLISILILTKTFTQILFFGLFGTKWGRDRKTTYIKEKINAQKK